MKYVLGKRSAQGSGPSWLLAGLAGVLLLLPACGPKNTGGDDDGGMGPCETGQLECNMSGTAIMECDESGEWVEQTLCEGQTPYCYHAACVACLPMSTYCDGNDVMQCDADGTGTSLVETCTANDTCQLGACVDACEAAAGGDSNVGCHFWPTAVNNAYLDPLFDSEFGVVVHNAQATDVTVQITRGAQIVMDATVAAGEVEVIRLDYMPALKGASAQMESVLATSGGYHLRSSLPITVYQFNPLGFEILSSCVDSTENPCHSYSNDASLLLPEHTLSNNYVVVSRPTFGINKNGDPSDPLHFIPGFMSVVGTDEDTTVTIRFSAHTQAGDNLDPYHPGEMGQFQLGKGDVLQILSAIPSDCGGGTETTDDCNSEGGTDVCRYCDLGPLYDLTGTVIQATKPVAVYAGHVCAFVPYNNWACDHLEEQMIPSETWGSDYIVARTEPQSPDVAEPNVVRILSREDDNQLQFEPSSVHASVNLSANEYIEFVSAENFRVTADKPIMVAQYLVGQSYYTNIRDYWGDPAFALVVPFEQYRTDYTFLVPETMTYNYVNVIGPVGEAGQNIHNITLDGTPIDFSAGQVGSYGIARVDLSNYPTSYHTITGDEPFGIMVYGFARFTSYFYPGGLNLEYINPVD